LYQTTFFVYCALCLKNHYATIAWTSDAIHTTEGGGGGLGVRVMVFNAISNNISVRT